MHTIFSSVCDFAAGSEEEASVIGREIASQWSKPRKWDCQRDAVEAPAYDPEERYGFLPGDPRRQFDMGEIIARLVGGNRFHDYQPNYGQTLVCGYANVWGYKDGILADKGVLFNESSLKGAHFIELCDVNKRPLVFLQNITGYRIGRDYVRRGIAKDGAKMIMAQAGVRLPKFTIVCNGSFGAGNYGMCGRAFDARVLLSWSNHQIGVMGGDQVARGARSAGGARMDLPRWWRRRRRMNRSLWLRIATRFPTSTIAARRRRRRVWSSVIWRSISNRSASRSTPALTPATG